MRRLWWAVLPAVLAMSACGSGSGGSGGAVPDQPSTAATSKAARVPAGSITQSGVLIVGTEVKPGSYRAVVPQDSPGCYYARLSSLDETDIIANGLGDPGNRMTVTIRRTDKAFKTDGCGVWVPVK